MRVSSPFIGGGFGAKLWLRADALLAALGARAARRPVRIAMPRALIPNNTVHRSATIQRIRIGATRDGKITAIAHESWSRQPAGGRPGSGGDPDPLALRRPAPHDVEPPRGARPAGGERDARAERSAGAGRARDRDRRDGGEARHGSDRVPDRQRHAGRSRQPGQAGVDRSAVEGRRRRSTTRIRRSRSASWSSASGWARRRFGWNKRNPQPGRVRDGRWLVGIGVAAAIRDNLVMNSGARVRLDRRGCVIVETDMTDIGTGSYTVIAQTAAEMMGVRLEQRQSCAWAIRPSRCPAAPAASGAATARPPASTRPA